MKLISDIHLEFGQYIDVSGDFIVAGDIHSSPEKVIRWVKRQKNAFIIFIAGNHEYYSGVEPLEYFKANCPENAVFLNNSFFETEDTRYVGATLWSYIPPTEYAFVSTAMNDYRKGLTVEDTVRMHLESVEYIFNNLSSTKRNVVITHHLPTYKSVSNIYSNSPYNCAFATELGERIMDSNIAVWCHGHTHTSWDYMLGNTRIVCNPFGYRFYEENPDFKKKGVLV